MIKRMRKYKRRVVGIALVASCAGIIALFVAGYVFAWNWTGLPNKSLWDWMLLLIVPVVLSVATFSFSWLTNQNDQKIAQQRGKTEQRLAEQRNKTEQRLAEQREQEDLLQVYLDRMSELLLEKNLRKSEPHSEVRNIARARTLTVLSRLSKYRKATMLQFLHEANLIGNTTDSNIISLQGASLWEGIYSSLDLPVVC